jgi:TolB-like protein/Tfp pilus assembly protein PilF
VPGDVRLDSWKEIAAYFDRDVTTLRRWEKHEGLPIHRLHHGKLGSVYAYRSELDAWRRQRARRSAGAPPTEARLPRLAVLPLENLSHDPEQEYFADGMTEALLTQLSSLHSVRVVSRTSVMQFKGRCTDLQEVARLLDVGAVIEGAVTRSDSRVRITVRLVDGSSAENLWAQAYERDLSDVLSIQREFALAIAQRIEAAVSQAEQSRLAAARPVVPAAFESYLRGRFHLNKYTRAGLEDSVRHFEAAIAIDPTYALPHAGLAVAYDLLGTFFIGFAPPSAMRANAVAAAEKAIELDPHVASAHTVLANAHQQEWRWTEAEAAHRRAIHLNPSDAIAHLGLAALLAARGFLEDAVATAARAREYDPLSLQTHAAIGVHLYFARRFDEAIAHFRSVQDLEPNHVWSLWHLGLSLLETSRFDDAIEALTRAVAASERSATPLGSLAMAYGRAGRDDDAQRILAELEALRQTRYVPPAAYLHAYLGGRDRDQAFAALEDAYQERSYIMQFLAVLPLLDPLRDDSRFVEMLQRLGLR